MNLQPVSLYRARYPDKYEVDLNRLLLTHKPERLKSASAALLLSALCMSSLSGCGQAVPAGTGALTEQTTAAPSSENETAAVAGLKDGPTKNGVRTMRMAPLYEDGIIITEEESETSAAADSTAGKAPDTAGKLRTKGKLYATQLGGYASDTVMTEQEALAVIQNVLKEYGLKSEASKKETAVDGDNYKSVNWTFDLNIEGAKEPVYAEFITLKSLEPETETAEWTAAGLPDSSNEAAAALHEKLSYVQDESTGVVFYFGGNVPYNEELYLKLQVEEFVQWMKTEGLI